jgi:hypothetical protein
MFSIVVQKFLELQIPFFLVRLVPAGGESKTNLVELPFPSLIHSAILEPCTLTADPIAQWWVFLVLTWHIACNSGRETGGVLIVGYSRRRQFGQETKTTHNDHVFL